MKTLIIADIHGNYKGLLDVLDKAGFDPESDLLISLGDIVDGFPESWECVEFLRKLPHAIFIKGNHDDAFMSFIESGIHGYGWTQGAQWTLHSYLQRDIDGNVVDINPESTSLIINKEHADFFYSQVYFHIRDNRFYCHAGFENNVELKKQLLETLLLDRNLIYENYALHQKDKKVSVNILGTDCNEYYIGHTNTSYLTNKYKPLILGNLHCLDTGGGAIKGRITVMNADTKEYFQSEQSHKYYGFKIKRSTWPTWFKK